MTCQVSSGFSATASWLFTCTAAPAGLVPRTTRVPSFVGEVMGSTPGGSTQPPMAAPVHWPSTQVSVVQALPSSQLPSRASLRQRFLTGSKRSVVQGLLSSHRAAPSTPVQVPPSHSWPGGQTPVRFCGVQAAPRSSHVPATHEPPFGQTPAGFSAVQSCAGSRQTPSTHVWLGAQPQACEASTHVPSRQVAPVSQAPVRFVDEQSSSGARQAPPTQLDPVAHRPAGCAALQRRSSARQVPSMQEVPSRQRPVALSASHRRARSTQVPSRQAKPASQKPRGSDAEQA